MPTGRLATIVAASDARRTLLHLQGIGGPPMRSGTDAVGRLVERLGYVQIDSINVIERAHHLILATRLAGYRASHLTQNLERARRLFEHWTHDACAIPVRWFPHWKRRFAEYEARVHRNRWWQERFHGKPGPVLARTLERVRAEGPLRARDFPVERERRGAGWWEWHPEKAALEHLWRAGVLAIARRDGFEKVYDLMERVHPDQHAAPEPDDESHVDWACSTALDRLGIATLRDISAFWNSIDVAAVRRWCGRKLAEGAIERVTVERADGGRAVPCVALPTWRSHAKPVDDERMVAMCPFDPVLRDRARTERLFGFAYRFEAFVPAPKRRYGYYVMPLLEGDRFVGRVDPKFDRERGAVVVRGPWWERGVKPDRGRMRRLGAALDRLATSVGANSWSLESPGAAR
ncbi:MAG: crosslink repair DNA glycosylase YcaQ family protein [Phycisphaerales bacterium]